MFLDAIEPRGQVVRCNDVGCVISMVSKGFDHVTRSTREHDPNNDPCSLVGVLCTPKKNSILLMDESKIEHGDSKSLEKRQKVECSKCDYPMG